MRLLVSRLHPCMVRYLTCCSRHLQGGRLRRPFSAGRRSRYPPQPASKALRAILAWPAWARPGIRRDPSLPCTLRTSARKPAGDTPPHSHLRWSASGGSFCKSATSPGRPGVSKSCSLASKGERDLAAGLQQQPFLSLGRRKAAGPDMDSGHFSSRESEQSDGSPAAAA